MFFSGKLYSGELSGSGYTAAFTVRQREGWGRPRLLTLMLFSEETMGKMSRSFAGYYPEH
jgi:hypothetical protein